MTDLTDGQNFLSGQNALFLTGLYAKYLQDRHSVDISWRDFFDTLGDQEETLLHDLMGAQWAPRIHEASQEPSNSNSKEAKSSFSKGVVDAVKSPIGISEEEIFQAAKDSVNALMLIRSFRVRGHLNASLDPLELEHKEKHPEIMPEKYGFADLNDSRPIFINGVLGRKTATIREIVDVCQRTYCGSVGTEFMHIQDPSQRDFIQMRIEDDSAKPFLAPQERLEVHGMLCRADTFERFLNVKHTGAKRFGIEGGEACIPAIEEMLKLAVSVGVEEVVFGMAHRGRLNLLTNVLGKPAHEIFSEFSGSATLAEGVQGSGDVKYHLGVSADRVINGHPLHVSLTANPSHLEAVDPVVIGKVRAKQALIGDKERRRVLPVLLHGDAAFCGQGLVGETLALSELDGYRSGGTIHFIINNQIGFTTNPSEGRSSPYSSDVAKNIQAPIFHVNGDDPEAVVYVTKLAFEFRQKFKKDVVIDMFCYRRQGHNEMDEPSFTQPLMYQKIKSHPTTYEIYSKKLVESGVLSSQQPDEIKKTVEMELQTAFEQASASVQKTPDWLKGKWEGYEVASLISTDVVTGVSRATLEEMGRSLTTVPQEFSLNPKLVRLFEQKRKMFETGENFDWATAEALAFGSLLLEGNPVRLSGQDVGRGTFSQRHAILTDQENGTHYVPLNHLGSDQASIEVLNSPLAEASILGFEYGYSTSDPKTLVLWEAQFGDFANGAQVIIDQFISSGEVKWFRMSGIVMMLPHGSEGQGPEHSSARPERYLQLCAENNMIVANCTTPANYFHILRRQIRRNFRKPLILMTPKSLLRHKHAVSHLNDMAEGTKFMPVIPEVKENIKPENVRRIILCTGKVYYDLLEYREQQNIQDTVILRLEQIYPFSEDLLKVEFEKYPHALVVWCQEEPENMGCWNFLERRLERVLTSLQSMAKRPLYAGRREAASPATGFLKKHIEEQEKLVKDAFEVGKEGSF